MTEQAPAALPLDQAQRFSYGTFSARYGNVYTTLQLLQLVQRALGDLRVRDQFWQDSSGRIFDLLRPRIVPRGFASLAEAKADTIQHLRAVRTLFETTAVFIFTLGLTECWMSREDGIVYPTCPGCGNAGEYDALKYEFRNLSVAQTTSNLSAAIDLIVTANPGIQIILTVSPVPLIATMEPRHVLQATTYSKSVLRVAAEEAVRAYSNVHYFASYEIITGTRNAHVFIGEDGRTIANVGVERAMDLFFRHFARASLSDAVPENDGATDGGRAPDIVCDEEDFFRALAESQPINRDI